MIYFVIFDMEFFVFYIYFIEFVIVEKFEVMIDLGEMNIKMKDFYDVYYLLKNYIVDDVILEEVIW